MGRAFIAGLMMTMAGAVVAQETVAPAPTQALSRSPGVVVFPAQGQNAQQQQQRELFNKAFSACMQAKSYTVN